MLNNARKPVDLFIESLGRMLRQYNVVQSDLEVLVERAQILRTAQGVEPTVNAKTCAAVDAFVNCLVEFVDSYEFIAEDVKELAERARAISEAVELDSALFYLAETVNYNMQAYTQEIDED